MHHHDWRWYSFISFEPCSLEMGSEDTKHKFIRPWKSSNYFQKLSCASYYEKLVDKNYPFYGWRKTYYLLNSFSFRTFWCSQAVLLCWAPIPFSFLLSFFSPSTFILFLLSYSSPSCPVGKLIFIMRERIQARFRGLHESEWAHYVCTQLTVHGAVPIW